MNKLWVSNYDTFFTEFATSVCRGIFNKSDDFFTSDTIFERFFLKRLKEGKRR